MNNHRLAVAIAIQFLLLSSICFADVAFPGAEGFGALAQGGKGGDVYYVTTLEDSNKEGSLRWAVSRNEPRIIRFRVDGVVQLKAALNLVSPFITVDGRDALDGGKQGITIRDYPINVRTHDVIIRYIRVRLGDYAVLKRTEENGWERHQGSVDLDCINIHESRNVIVDHVSASWSTDEVISVTNSRNVTIQWSIIAEPLANPRAHPYGDNHAYGANNSASTVTYHHCLFAHYVMRGPQFEANDMDKKRPFDVKFEAINNVIYAYTKTGSRYRTGFENPARDRIETVGFYYHFIGNKYVNRDKTPSEIEAHDAFGTETNIAVYVRDNLGPHRPDPAMDQLALVFTDIHGRNNITSEESCLKQVSLHPLFVSPAPVTIQDPNDAYEAILRDAGCSLSRDEHDIRIINDLKAVAPARVINSQEQVGGWPTWCRP
ncbi:polysaccharide lyase family 1 protein [Candidatus Poribacteria bacterium]